MPIFIYSSNFLISSSFSYHIPDESSGNRLNIQHLCASLSMNVLPLNSISSLHMLPHTQNIPNIKEKKKRCAMSTSSLLLTGGPNHILKSSFHLHPDLLCNVVLLQRIMHQFSLRNLLTQIKTQSGRLKS